MDEKNFIIEDGVFKKYDGSEVKVLEIPEGVEGILVL